jgi:ATP-binding cassette, subfamily B, multidrug efflux pump
LRTLFTLNKYFWKYKLRFFFGIGFTILANYFGVLSPQVARYIINKVKEIVTKTPNNNILTGYDNIFHSIIQYINQMQFGSIVIWCGIVLVILALLKGLFTYLMRQTIIVMSRHIEFDQKNEIYKHYQTLDSSFMKKNATGDLMNRISDDVSKVRMYTGPALMYATNLITLIGLSVWFMYQKSPLLTLCTLAPLPILAYVIFKVNVIINNKSELQQAKLSELTSNAQESYSGIRVIKSFVQEKSSFLQFEKNSNTYKDAAISLSKTEAWYFPSIALLIGISTLITIMVGGLLSINNKRIDEGTIAEFVMYVSMLSFPFSSIGWVASIIQKAKTSQRRINEFLDYETTITDGNTFLDNKINHIHFKNVNFTYEDTLINAIKQLKFEINANEKIAIVGSTGCGKTTLVQLILRILDNYSGTILLNQLDIKQYKLLELRNKIAYVPQEVFLFSDSIKNNIKFGNDSATDDEVIQAAKNAKIYDEIMSFENNFETIVGERGVTLSGGQKQRISIARALLKNAEVYIFDDCLSAVDVNTEYELMQRWQNVLQNKISIFVTHRVTYLQNFTNIIVMEEGQIIEQGNHTQLSIANGTYSKMLQQQSTNTASK